MDATREDPDSLYQHISALALCGIHRICSRQAWLCVVIVFHHHGEAMAPRMRGCGPRSACRTGCPNRFANAVRGNGSAHERGFLARLKTEYDTIPLRCVGRGAV